ncbi:MAG: two-component system response regulator [Deltaproteobacteria bacterium HGW-Deltaproteobacteria-15]|jgi:two-component system response regulator|nr:MAG: two-component system response regulator [Deltaproteobacteria bacterium HGW-Deltaproteobacteria-15]
MNVEKVNIVLVEDNPFDVELTLHALEKHNLANCVKVLNDGQEALDYILTRCVPGGTGCPHLVLLDLKLPKIDGLEVLQRIRSNEDTKLLPVVVLTSSAEDRDRVESYKLGVNSYIVKPVGFDTFAKVVSEVGFYWVLVNKPAF